MLQNFPVAYGMMATRLQICDDDVDIRLPPLFIYTCPILLSCSHDDDDKTRPFVKHCTFCRFVKAVFIRYCNASFILGYYNHGPPGELTILLLRGRVIQEYCQFLWGSMIIAFLLLIITTKLPFNITLFVVLRCC